MDQKLDGMSRKLNILWTNSGASNSASIDVPAVPDGMTLPADSVKTLKAAASRITDERTRKQLVSNFIWHLIFLMTGWRYNVFYLASFIC